MANGTFQKNMVLLWENPSPTSAFGAQTLSLDLSSYDAVMVVYHASQTNLFYGNPVTAFFDENAEWVMSYVTNSGNNFMRYSRSFFVTRTGIQFRTAYSMTQGAASAEKQDCNIPYRIYGIKA